VTTLFRTFDEMNPIEQTAIEQSSGRTLDVGAGAGCHTLELQTHGINVTAIDISTLAVETMLKRGVEDARAVDFFEMPAEERFDTILMLMNGTGIAGTLNNLGKIFERLDLLLADGGQLLIDSSDLRYIFEDEDGTFDPTEFDHYYGEVDYRMVYGNLRSEKFDWLYADFDTLKQYAERMGYEATIVYEGENFDYLARITRKTMS
ncbi:MAG: methyltransferase domain-containing protein, partial [Bacteroidaceae bacterium]|nr:methyltransferase domain-containing protein [Bacteroidaceae bacterium]